MLLEILIGGLVALQEYIALHIATCLIPASLLADNAFFSGHFNNYCHYRLYHRTFRTYAGWYRFFWKLYSGSNFFIIGLHLLEIIPLPFLGRPNQPTFQKRGLLAAFGLGLIFGIALGPCTFAYIVPMLGTVFAMSVTQFFYGVALLFIYGIGHCSVIVFAGTFTEIFQNYLNWNERSKGVVLVKKIRDVLVIIVGFYLIWSIWKGFNCG